MHLRGYTTARADLGRGLDPGPTTPTPAAPPAREANPDGSVTAAGSPLVVPSGYQEVPTHLTEAVRRWRLLRDRSEDIAAVLQSITEDRDHLRGELARSTNRLNTTGLGRGYRLEVLNGRVIGRPAMPDYGRSAAMGDDRPVEFAEYAREAAEITDLRQRLAAKQDRSDRLSRERTPIARLADACRRELPARGWIPS